MSVRDKSGRPYARLAELRPGDVLEADGGFTCLNAGARTEVKIDMSGNLYVECEEKVHYLNGQDDGDGCLVGLYRAPQEKPSWRA